MPTFEVTLRDRSVETVADVDAYQQEGTMTTFFRLGPDRRVVDSWSERVASVRTADILVVRRRDDHDASELADRAEATLWAVS